MKSRVVIEKLVVGSMSATCYLIIDQISKETLILDPGDDSEYIIDKIREYNVKPQLIVATHGHFDHVMAARALQLAYKIPFAIHSEDIFLVKRMVESAQHFLGITPDPPPEISKKLNNNDVLQLGTTSIKVLHLPGHTPGSIALTLASEKILFVGDTIFADGAVGRTDFSYSNKNDLTASIASILALPEDTKLLPGHGQSTTVHKEKVYHRV